MNDDRDLARNTGVTGERTDLADGRAEAGPTTSATVGTMRWNPERLEYLFGAEALGQLEAYDLDDDADLREAIERFLLTRSGPGLTGPRAAARQIAITQILDDDPPEAWQAALRLRADGFDRDAVLGQMTMVIAEALLEALSADVAVDPATMAAGYDALPLPEAAEIATALVTVARANPGIDADSHVSQTIAALGSTSGERLLEPMVDRVLESLLDGPLHWLADDATVVFHDTVARRVLTHRFNEAERELGALTVSVDCAGFTRFDTVRLADGTELEQFSVEPHHVVWHGPDGWLDRFQPGDLVALTATFESPRSDEWIDATIAIELLDHEPEATPDLLAAVRAAYDREVEESGLPVSSVDLMVNLCHHRPELFTSPLPPLSDCIEAAGLQLDGGLMAHDQAMWHRDLLFRRLRQVADAVPEPQWRRVLGQAVEVLDDPAASVESVRASLGACAEPEVLDVLVDVLVPEHLAPDDEFALGTPGAPVHVFELVDRALAAARRPAEQATAHYLACVLRERCGQPALAAEHLARVAAARPHLGSAVERMGWYAFDRGDARGAMRWWGQLDAPHPAAGVIAPFLTPAAGASKIGRNDPCWCGSGRKYKQCHQVVSDHPPLPDRVGWLYRKAVLWLEHSVGGARSLMTDLAIAWVTGDPEADAHDIDTEDDDVQLQFQRAFSDPLLFDAALFEGRLIRHFLHQRGDLLPEDERLLAASWLTVERSVHEVVAIDRGVGMTLRNLATGDGVEVRERSASRQVEVGERYCVRVVPDGASNQIVGGVFEVRAGHETTVLDLCDDADPVALCAWAGAVAAPPRIVHRPGMIDSMLDRQAIEQSLADLGDIDEAGAIAHLNAEISRQMQARWLDENVPALGGLTPRQAAADPTRRELLERLLDEFERTNEQIRQQFGIGSPTGMPISYDVPAMRRELGLG